jgi:hypothetical protein
VIAIPARRSGGIWSLVHARDLEMTAALIGAILASGGAAGAGGGSRRRARSAGTAPGPKTKRNRRGGRR